MNMPLRPLLVVLVSCLATVTLAEPPGERSPGRSPAEMIKQVDSDGDGRVSREEFMKARTAKLEKAFERIDTDGSGLLEQQELETVAQRLRGLLGGGGGPAGRNRPPRPEGPPRQRSEETRPPRREGERPGAGPLAAGIFDRLDRDGDGRLSRGEFEEGMSRMREFMRQRGGPGGRGLGRPAFGGGGPEEGFRRPPQQD